MNLKNLRIYTKISSQNGLADIGDCFLDCFD